MIVLIILIYICYELASLLQVDKVRPFHSYKYLKMSTILHSQIIEIYYNMQARLNFNSSDASILNIKRQFSCYINQMKSSTGYESIISQMEDLKSMLYFLKVSVINTIIL